MTSRRPAVVEPMKTRLWKPVSFVAVLGLVVWTLAPQVTAQTPPVVGLRFSAGHPTLSLTGDPGTVYSIQYASDFTATNPWTDRALLQAQSSATFWTDPTPSSMDPRFYRAVSVAAPANSNLVFIQPGTFTMGSPPDEVGRDSDEGPQTTVIISRGFWMGKYEVTQGEYEALTGSNPSWCNGDRTAAGGLNYGIDTNRPVELVSWLDAIQYCSALTQKERAANRIPPDSLYRLPTEAEWEYACRAWTSTRFSYGDDPGYTNLANYAWFGDVGGTTHPVGEKPANPWGLHDMHGNVWEWCQDWVGEYAGGTALDPQGPDSSGSGRVFRGGGCSTLARSCRSASRNSSLSFNSFGNVGFRVVLAPGTP